MHNILTNNPRITVFGQAPFNNLYASTRQR